MADEQDIQVIVAEMIGGKIIIFGMPTEDNPGDKIKGWVKTTDMQFLTRQEAFACPFCKKTLVMLGSPKCPACNADFTSAEAQAALRTVQVESVYGTRIWSQRHDLRNDVRLNADNIIAWSIAEDWSETRAAWFKEREDAKQREADARAERSGVVAATEAQAAVLAKTKQQIDATLRNLPGDNAGPFQVVK